MKVCIEKYEAGRWKEFMSFDGYNMMGKGRENFAGLLRNHPDWPIRLIVVHADHDGTSASMERMKLHR